MSERPSPTIVASPTPPRTPGAGRLWTGALAGPIAWLLNLGLSYLLTDWSCNTGHEIVIHLVNLVALLVALAGAALAWSIWEGAAPSGPTGAPPPIGRVRFMALSGMILSLLFALAIIAQGVPPFILNACQR